VVLDSDLNRLLRSVGLRVFVEYYHVFSDSRLSNQEAAGLLPHDYKLTARLTRVSCARRIIERGQTAEVLRFISESKRVDAATSQAALSMLGDA
jgi:hypothetical protein